MEVTALAMVYSLVSRTEDNIEKIVEDFTKDVQTFTNSLLLSASTVSYVLIFLYSLIGVMERVNIASGLFTNFSAVLFYIAIHLMKYEVTKNVEIPGPFV